MERILLIFKFIIVLSLVFHREKPNINKRTASIYYILTRLSSTDLDLLYN